MAERRDTPGVAHDLVPGIGVPPARKTMRSPRDQRLVTGPRHPVLRRRRPGEPGGFLPHGRRHDWQARRQKPAPDRRRPLRPGGGGRGVVA